MTSSVHSRYAPERGTEVTTRFLLGTLDAASHDWLESIPGIRLNGTTATVPTNALWLALELGLLEIAGPTRREIRTAKAALPWLRPWVSEFLIVYQREGVFTALASPGESHLFVWSAGSGKTLGAIVWSLAAGNRLTVVCTKSGIRPTWNREIETYTTGVYWKVLTGERPEPIELPTDRPSILVVGYDTLPAWIDVLTRLRPPSLVFDEIHLLKSHKRWRPEVGDDGVKLRFSLLDNRSAAAYRLARIAKRRLGTTATPVTDRVRDLWAELDLIHPGEWGPYWKWAQRYAGATENRFGGMDDRGKTNLAELKRRIELVRHRVPYSVANRSLPPKRRLVTYVSVKEQCRAEGGIGKEIKRAARHGPTALLEARIMEAASRKRQIVLAHARDALEAKQKVVIFTGRRSTARGSRKTPGGVRGFRCRSGRATGDSPEKREIVRKSYMEAPDRRY
jgi:hypothetical protein